MLSIGMSHFDDASTAVALPLFPRLFTHPLPIRDAFFVEGFLHPLHLVVSPKHRGNLHVHINSILPLSLRFLIADPLRFGNSKK